MRTVLVLVALALALPTAGALGASQTDLTGADGEPMPVAIGPDGLAQEGEPYYLRADPSAPDAPRSATKDDDCGYNGNGTPRTGPQRLAGKLAGDIQAWDPLAEPRISGWFPTCLATTVTPGSIPAQAYVAYDVETGRYYVEATTPIPLNELPIPLFFTAQTTSAMTGTTGVGLMADCELCPPPGA
ncbi:MAG TPA: hypothetical protein VM370_00255 [Candidatus Thermoplasmatota archaeon]|nr:hypothetical protein [Candidatus Thermoplasmatota archaeon]